MLTRSRAVGDPSLSSDLQARVELQPWGARTGGGQLQCLPQPCGECLGCMDGGCGQTWSGPCNGLRHKPS